MRLIGGVLASAVAVAALAASATAASRKYEGTFTNAAEGSFALTAKVRHGKAVEIIGFNYSGLPATCTVSPPPQTISGGFRFRGVRVRDGRTFRGRGRDQAGSAFVLSGRFSPGFRAVKGTVQATIRFPPEDPPAETCTTNTEPYTAGG